MWPPARVTHSQNMCVYVCVWEEILGGLSIQVAFMRVISGIYTDKLVGFEVMTLC